jgi:hypothetical protein
MNNLFNILLVSVAAVLLVLFIIGMTKELKQSMRNLHKEKKVKS